MEHFSPLTLGNDLGVSGAEFMYGTYICWWMQRNLDIFRFNLNVLTVVSLHSTAW